MLKTAIDALTLIAADGQVPSAKIAHEALKAIEVAGDAPPFSEREQWLTIQFEKMLCAKLGRKWNASVSTTNLLEELLPRVHRDATTRPLFDTMLAGFTAQVRIEEKLTEILGFAELLGITWDPFDASLEIFPLSDVDDLVLTDEQHQRILAMGVNRYWINFPDGEDRADNGPRRKAAYNRWEGFHSGRMRRREPSVAINIKDGEIVTAQLSVAGKAELGDGRHVLYGLPIKVTP